MIEHPNTESLRGMANKYPLPRNVAEMLWVAAAEIDRLRAVVAEHNANLITGGGASARPVTHTSSLPPHLAAQPAEVCCGHPLPAPDAESGALFCMNCDTPALAAGEPPAEVCLCGHGVDDHYKSIAGRPWCVIDDGVCGCESYQPSAGGSGVGAPTPVVTPHEFVPAVFDQDRCGLTGMNTNWPYAHCLGLADDPVHGVAPTPPAEVVKCCGDCGDRDCGVYWTRCQREMERGDDHA